VIGGARHLYVHLPFCAHRCGYCDFVTVVGRKGDHEAYVDAVLKELSLEARLLVRDVESLFLGGGTPTFLELGALERLLGALPAADEVTVEANPETIGAALARSLRALGVNRVSVGAQSFRPHLLRVLDRVAEPDTIRRAFYHLRDAGFDNISLDLIYGIPGQSAADLDADLADALALGPEHLSCYELEAKPRTRFTHAHGAALARQAAAMEEYFGLVVERLTAAGYRWYETANFCRRSDLSDGRDLRAKHNLAYWRGRDYLGLGLGAVSTIDGRRWRNTPRLAAYVQSLERGTRPPRDVEPLAADVRDRERLMLGLRLDEPLRMVDVARVVDHNAVARLEALGLVRTRPVGTAAGTLTLTGRGRLLGGGVTVDLLAESRRTPG
jgi:oxygen-independent coproporphyrinogen III oxidase